MSGRSLRLCWDVFEPWDSRMPYGVCTQGSLAKKFGFVG